MTIVDKLEVHLYSIIFSLKYYFKKRLEFPGDHYQAKASNLAEMKTLHYDVLFLNYALNMFQYRNY